MQSRKLVARSLGRNFHAAIVVVANPPGNAQDVRLALHKPAEADPLNTTANDEPAGLNRLFSGSHFREIAEVRSQNAEVRSSRF
jgi:hypothetical protein